MTEHSLIIGGPPQPTGYAATGAMGLSARGQQVTSGAAGLMSGNAEPESPPWLPRPPEMYGMVIATPKIGYEVEDLGRLAPGEHSYPMGFGGTSADFESQYDSHLLLTASPEGTGRTIVSPAISTEQQTIGVLNAVSSVGFEHSPEDARIGVYLGKTLPATGLAYSNGVISTASDELAIDTTTALVTGFGIRGSGRIPTADLPLPAASLAAVSPGVADDVIAEAATPLARASELFASFSPFDRASVEQALDQFLERLGDVDVELMRLGESTNLGPWVMTSAALLSVAEIVRRRVREQGRLRHASVDEEEDPSLLGLPGLPGRWDSEGS